MDVRFSLEDGGVEFSLKNGHVGPPIFGGEHCHEWGNTAKTSFGEDLVKIRPAVAEQSRKKRKKKKEPPLKYKTFPSHAASGAF